MAKWYKIIKKISILILFLCSILGLFVAFDIITAQPYRNIIKYVVLSYSCLYLLFWVFDLLYSKYLNKKK